MAVKMCALETREADPFINCEIIYHFLTISNSNATTGRFQNVTFEWKSILHNREGNE
jgi:hypothetical protein